jgi:hypothetical protein
MADFNTPDWLDYLNSYPADFLSCNEFTFGHIPNTAQSDDTKSSNTAASSSTLSDAAVEGTQLSKSQKRRRISESPEHGALIRPRKTRKLRDPHDTAKIREKGACFCCQKKRKEVNNNL